MSEKTQATVVASPAAIACVACWIMAQAVAPPRFMVAERRRLRSPIACWSWKEPMPRSLQPRPGFRRRPSRSSRASPASSRASSSASTAKPMALVSNTLPWGVIPSPTIAAAPRSGWDGMAILHPGVGCAQARPRESPRLAVMEHGDAVGEAALARQLGEPRDRLVDRLVGHHEGAPVDRHHVAGVEVDEDPERVLGIHVDAPERGRAVGADREERDVDRPAAAVLAEAREVGGVAREEDGAVRVLEEEARVASLVGPEVTGAPVLHGQRGDADAFHEGRVAPRELDHLRVARARDETGEVLGHHGDRPLL